MFPKEKMGSSLETQNVNKCKQAAYNINMNGYQSQSIAKLNSYIIIKMNFFLKNK